jgi:hypothetical protein
VMTVVATIRLWDAQKGLQRSVQERNLRPWQKQAGRKKSNTSMRKKHSQRFLRKWLLFGYEFSGSIVHTCPGLARRGSAVSVPEHLTVPILLKPVNGEPDPSAALRGRLQWQCHREQLFDRRTCPALRKVGGGGHSRLRRFGSRLTYLAAE